MTRALATEQGCKNSLFGPTLQDMLILLDTTEEKMAIVDSVKHLVVIASTFVVSYSFERIGHRQCKLTA